MQQPMMVMGMQQPMMVPPSGVWEGNFTVSVMGSKKSLPAKCKYQFKPDGTITGNDGIGDITGTFNPMSGAFTFTRPKDSCVFTGTVLSSGATGNMNAEWKAPKGGLTYGKEGQLFLSFKHA